jgi:hypothetical protein
MDLLRAALQELDHGFLVEDTPVSDRMVSEVKFGFDLVGRVMTAITGVSERADMLDPDYALDPLIMLHIR